VTLWLAGPRAMQALNRSPAMIVLITLCRPGPLEAIVPRAM